LSVGFEFFFFRLEQLKKRTDTAGQDGVTSLASCRPARGPKALREVPVRTYEPGSFGRAPAYSRLSVVMSVTVGPPCSSRRRKRAETGERLRRAPTCRRPIVAHGATNGRVEGSGDRIVVTCSKLWFTVCSTASACRGYGPRPNRYGESWKAVARVLIRRATMSAHAGFHQGPKLRNRRGRDDGVIAQHASQVGRFGYRAEIITCPTTGGRTIFTIMISSVATLEHRKWCTGDGSVSEEIRDDPCVFLLLGISWGCRPMQHAQHIRAHPGTF